MKAAALRAAERGWRVFPLVPGAKRPAIKSWETRATTDTERIARCWDHGPYNVGLAAGPSGLVVVDLDRPKHANDRPKEPWSQEDVRDGVDVLAVIASRQRAPYPKETFTVATVSGGRHLYFLAPDGAQLHNTAGKLGWKVDTRAYGGYVVAAGSVVDGNPYVVAVDSEPTPLPTWLGSLLRPAPVERRAVPTPSARSSSRYADAALRNETANVAGAQEGTRNATLVRAARALGRLVASGDLTRVEVEDALKGAASAAGLAERESAPAITSALNWSIANNPKAAA
ncbi:bifunctional DNA primase/polymerase [Yinghuangia seranimata]|uniref:bifunctional DNA primase/polymerase n=1 Tax=Yinghuangia seranimata TaxID=408067 RepID=UPI00248D1359|nr:bifunctional DNA primase/polymerase [Yinghuangia seranimata]MDI2127797.1 bifunctional DNA primase/polymerase [Yinghuangia seranimata]